ncbi:MAG TPA: endonuclease III [Candidatus Paceibacterota bacterium]
MNFQILNPNSKAQATKALSALKKQYSGAKIALNYSNHIQLLVAVILSAQCTDKKVNEVTEKLFRKYKTVGDFANADKKTFEQEVKSCGFYKMKAKNIIASAKKIQKDFGGKLPRAMKEILTLPGVARKTANVVLGNAYGVTEGIAVDTHVKRFAEYCGLSQYSDPNKIEQDLMRLFPKKDWFNLTYMIIDHGRSWRTNKKSHPKCGVCKLCPKFILK